MGSEESTVKFCKMIISFLLLFSIQFLSYESKPPIRNDKLSQFEGNEAGYELYHKLDEAAQKALDLAEEAKSFAEEAGKLQEREDTELTERKNAIEKSAFLLQNYRSAFRKHFNPEENFASRVKRMADEKDKKKDKKSEGEEGDDAEKEDEGGEGEGDDGGEGDGEAEKEKEDKEPAEGDGAENAKGDYTKKNVETAKKHLLESDDLLQQLQGKFSDILKEFGEDPSKLPAAKENENGKEPEEGKAEEDDEKKDDEDNGGDEKKEDDEGEGDAEAEEDEGDAETEDEDDAKPEGEDEEGLRKGKAKKKGKKAS